MALGATGAPLLSAAVWEERDGALRARFGPAWQPNGDGPVELPPEHRDARAGDAVMARIAALLPPAHDGASAEHEHAPPA